MNVDDLRTIAENTENMLRTVREVQRIATLQVTFKPDLSGLAEQVRIARLGILSNSAREFSESFQAVRDISKQFVGLRSFAESLPSNRPLLKSFSAQSEALRQMTESHRQAAQFFSQVKSLAGQTDIFDSFARVKRTFAQMDSQVHTLASITKSVERFSALPRPTLRETILALPVREGSEVQKELLLNQLTEELDECTPERQVEVITGLADSSANQEFRAVAHSLCLSIIGNYLFSVSSDWSTFFSILYLLWHYSGIAFIGTTPAVASTSRSVVARRCALYSSRNGQKRVVTSLAEGDRVIPVCRRGKWVRVCVADVTHPIGWIRIKHLDTDGHS